MMKRRIAHLTSVHPHSDTRILQMECKSLKLAGYEVTLIVPHQQDEQMDGVNIKSAGRKPTGRISRMTRTGWRVYREAVRENADIYHFHDSELIPVGLLLRLMGKKVVYDVHEDMPRTILSKYYLPIWARRPLAWLLERVENAACRRYSAIVTATQAIADRFTTLNNNTVVVQNFPRLEEAALHANAIWSQRACSIAYVGSITENRGIRQMVEAMNLLPDRLPAKLKLAGAYSPATLRDEITRLPGWSRVDDLGLLSRSGVIRLLGQVQAGLVLLHPESRYQVSFPVKMFEYMSAGIPVIASDFPLWRRIIATAGCGLLVEPLDVKSIADAIEYLLVHPQEAETMGCRGSQAVARHYNWGTEERKLLKLYADLAFNEAEVLRRRVTSRWWGIRT